MWKLVSSFCNKSYFFKTSHTLKSTDVCYTYGGAETCDLGCFTNDYPFGNTPVRPLTRLPLSPDELDSEYLLDTKDYLGHKLDPRDENSIKNSHFNKNEDLMIAIHGHTFGRDVHNSKSQIRDDGRSLLIFEGRWDCPFCVSKKSEDGSFFYLFTRKTRKISEINTINLKISVDHDRIV